MADKNILLTVSIQQADYEADCYGNLECEPKSIRVATIRAVKHVLDNSLRDAKQIVDDKFGVKVNGRVTLDFLTDEAGIGRIARLIYDQTQLTGTIYTVFEIINIRTIGNGVIQ